MYIVPVIGCATGTVALRVGKDSGVGVSELTTLAGLGIDAKVGVAGMLGTGLGMVTALDAAVGRAIGLERAGDGATDGILEQLVTIKASIDKYQSVRWIERRIIFLSTR